MNFLSQRHKARCHVKPIPNGLQELMFDITREVVRCQPTQNCTYKAIADYLDGQIRTREQSKIAMEVIEDLIHKTDEFHEHYVKDSLPKEKSYNFTDLMEKTFRRFTEKTRKFQRASSSTTFDPDDMLEELIKDCDLTKVDIVRLRPAFEWAYRNYVKTYIESMEGAPTTENFNVNVDKFVISCKELQELDAAAVLIQKVYRGRLARKSLRESMPSTMTSFERFILGRDELMNNAATKIQASYKGFITRKRLQAAPQRPQLEQELEWLEKFTEDHAEEINNAASKIQTRCQVLPMPTGLQDLMSDISREVLRCQPTIDCTYKFIADYLDAQIRTREKSRIAMEIIEDAILKTDEVYEHFVKCNIPKEKSINFMDLLETTFRRFVEQKRRLKRDPRYITFHADDMLEELTRKCDLTKVEILRSRPAIQWAYKKFVKTYLESIEGTLDTEDLYVSTDKFVLSCKELKELHDAAVLIQKVYRGYLTRRSLRRSLRGTLNVSMTSFELFILGRDEEIVNAAIKIQASYKGFITRKKLDAAPHLTRGEQELEWLEKFTAEHAEEINKAAVKIQAYYKGFSTRKKLLLELNIAEARHPVGLIAPSVGEEPPPPVVEEPPPAEDPSKLELVKEEEHIEAEPTGDGPPPAEGPAEEAPPAEQPLEEAPPEGE